MRSPNFYISPAYLSAIILLLLPMLSSCDDEKKQARSAPGVVVMTLAPQQIPLTEEFVGQTAGYREVEIRAQVSGILLRKEYTEGQIVKKDQLLFQIDSAPYKAALNQAKGNLVQAKARLYKTKLDNYRFIQLYKEEAVSQKERDDAVAAYRAAEGDMDVAKAVVQDAEINLGYTTVLAPITGAASEEHFSEGNLISVGQMLTTMVQLEPLYVNFSIPSADALRYADLIARGIMVPPKDDQFDVDIKLSDGSIYSGQGVVDFIGPSVDPATSSIKARAQLNNKGKAILPGQFARIYMKGYILKDVLVVPQRAVLNTQQGPIIYVIDADGKAQMKPFTQEMALGSDYILKSGAKSGDRIIVEGTQKVEPGAPVRIIKDMTASEKSTNSTIPKTN